ncbi:hypothetical protein E2C01_015061 [Portunus trituberculatus]|uniref:Uncharacterized protein n=1 Tax=Portunus trituberculatus TaxID=210409 RepID=A0A5B7DLK2_PORTR|nr:hypothetical protein [Portunus trituberculatus]
MKYKAEQSGNVNSLHLQPLTGRQATTTDTTNPSAQPLHQRHNKKLGPIANMAGHNMQRVDSPQPD